MILAMQLALLSTFHMQLSTVKMLDKKIYPDFVCYINAVEV